MTGSRVWIGATRCPVRTLNTLVIGSGAAGLKAASALVDQGQTDVIVVTDRFGGGASSEAGSDKQTYYKLSTSGDRPDSAADMARDLAAGGSMHGDIALCEALGSLPAFFGLAALGVPFPHDRHGAFPGYKTDHDPRQRATSAGPLTSRLMVQALARDLKRKRVPILDRHQVVALIAGGTGGSRRILGAAALDLRSLDRPNRGLVLFNAVNVVLATGGPGGIYAASVYPESQSGSHGLAFEIGAAGRNLTESQFGLASTKFRWNLSGTYQQVVPRYISTDAGGGDEREFLNDHFPDMGSLATAVFLKGYQWPFDPRKIHGFGSSLIDLLVYRETVVLGRRVFLDYRRDPAGGGRVGPFAFDDLHSEARDYLRRSEALLPTPITRLRRMNPPAIDLFKSHGIDLADEPLEIAVCAQHNNGGLSGNIWWESNIRGLFPVGEVNGSHGVCRPGGSALNAGQVGAARAALFISRRRGDAPPAAAEFLEAAGARIDEILARMNGFLGKRPAAGIDPDDALGEIRTRMSAFGAQIRDPAAIGEAKAGAWRLHRRLRRDLRAASPRDLPRAFRTLDHALTHALYLEAIAEYLSRGGRSRGSFLVLDPDGERPGPTLGPEWTFSLARPEDESSRKILEIRLDGRGRPVKRWTEVHPVPESDLWFETVWNAYRNDAVVR